MIPQVTIYDEDNNSLDVEVPDGWSLMEVLRGQRMVAGECGGQMLCATCHIVIHPEDAEKLPPVSDDEDAMLGELESRQDTSRLSCQLRGTVLNGIRFQIGGTE